MRASLLPALGIAVALATSEEARAKEEDVYELPDLPRPLILPELTHREVEWTASTALGAVVTDARTLPEIVERLAVEVPIGPRRWFVGAAYETAYGSPDGSQLASTIVGGNAEVYGRTVWATRSGLAFGFGVGLMPPIATFARAGQGAGVAVAASSLQPWDAAFFRPGELTFRPFVDVRDVFGPFVVQFRQSFDWSLQVHDISDSSVYSASTLGFGWAATRLIGVGVEASEYYLIDAPLPDDQKDKFVVAASLRFRTETVQPAIGAFAGVHSFMVPDASSMWGLRFALTFVWDPREHLLPQLQGDL